MSRWSEYKEKNGVTPLDLLNPMSKHSTAELIESRMQICRGCPELIQLTTTCKKCGCFMSVKTALLGAECPIGKWGKETNEQL